uniref:Uncharacterized protein n=1 Tax=Catharus ustulatus TaxID=91951 RepID=A0A8C3UKQ2_CATUS
MYLYLYVYILNIIYLKTLTKQKQNPLDFKLYLNFFSINIFHVYVCNLCIYIMYNIHIIYTCNIHPPLPVNVLAPLVPLATFLNYNSVQVTLKPHSSEAVCKRIKLIMNNLVTPVVGFIEDTFQVTPNPDEVSEVFVVPLEYFVKPLNYKASTSETSSGYLTRIQCFTYDDQEHKRSFKIWGLTAHFAVFLALVIFGEKPTFEVDYDLGNLMPSSENYFINLYAFIYERKKSNL